MRGAIVVFVKTIELTPSKTRLAATIGEEEAHKFYEWGVKKIRQTVEHTCGEIKGIDPFWAIAEKEGVDHDRWIGTHFKRIWSGEGHLGIQMHNVTETLLSQGYDYIIITGMDIPDITTRHLTEAANFLEGSAEACVIGPTSDGGLYLYGGNSTTEQTAWAETDYKASDAWKQFLRSIGLHSTLILDTLDDVDYASDFEKVKSNYKEDVLNRRKIA